MIKIMKMCPEHVQAIAELEKVCFSAPWSERSIASELTNPLALWLVAENDGKVIGYIGSQSVLDEADMMNIAVSQDFRRLGVAETLVNSLIAQLRDGGVHSLCLEVRESNEPAKSLYKKLGFEQVGRRPNYYLNPKEAALILRKEWTL